MWNRLTRWDPFDDLRQMRRAMDRYADSFSAVPRELETSSLEEPLAIDVYDKDDQVVVKAALPGVHPDDIEVDVRDGVLHISAETKEEQDVREGDYLRQEYRYGRFSRSIQLPRDVDANKAEARFENGMLRLSFPKTVTDRSKRLRIEVKGAQAGGGRSQRQIEQQEPQKQQKQQKETPDKVS